MNEILLKETNLGINALRIENGAIDFLNANASGSSTVQVTHRVQTHITETLRTKWNEDGSYKADNRIMS